jgi:transcriptional regulator with XRE-family HTH domain
MSEIADILGANLVRCRRRVLLSQENVARRASLHRTEVSYIERGLRVPRFDTVVKLASAVEADLDELADGIAWVCGDLRQGAFVKNGQMSLATRLPSSREP